MLNLDFSLVGIWNYCVNTFLGMSERIIWIQFIEMGRSILKMGWGPQAE